MKCVWCESAPHVTVACFVLNDIWVPKYNVVYCPHYVITGFCNITYSYSILLYRMSGIFRVGKFWRKCHFEDVLNFH